MRDILTTLGCVVLPEQYSLSGADTAFDEQGRIKDEKVRRGAEAVGAQLAKVLQHWSN